MLKAKKIKTFLWFDGSGRGSRAVLAMLAMLKMVKLDIAKLKEAAK